MNMPLQLALFVPATRRNTNGLTHKRQSGNNDLVEPASGYVRGSRNRLRAVSAFRRWALLRDRLASWPRERRDCLRCAYLVACGAILVRAVREWVDE